MCGGTYRGLSAVAGVMGGGLWCPLTPAPPSSSSLLSLLGATVVMWRQVDSEGGDKGPNDDLHHLGLLWAF